jgi:type VI secretion system secreted protein Hcp
MKPISSGRMRQAVRVVFATGVAAVGAQAEAAVDSWLRIPGIAGESLVVDHKGDIDLVSFTQAFDSKACKIAVVKYLDTATPALSEAASKRTTLPNVTLTARKSGEGQKDFYTVTLLSSTVASVETASAGPDSPVTEAVAFSPRSVTISYRPQDAKGSLGSAVTSTINCEK